MNAHWLPTRNIPSGSSNREPVRRGCIPSWPYLGRVSVVSLKERALHTSLACWIFCRLSVTLRQDRHAKIHAQPHPLVIAVVLVVPVIGDNTPAKGSDHKRSVAILQQLNMSNLPNMSCSSKLPSRIATKALLIERTAPPLLRMLATFVASERVATSKISTSCLSQAAQSELWNRQHLSLRHSKVSKRQDKQDSTKNIQKHTKDLPATRGTPGLYLIILSWLQMEKLDSARQLLKPHTSWGWRQAEQAELAAEVHDRPCCLDRRTRPCAETLLQGLARRREKTLPRRQGVPNEMRKGVQNGN